MKHPWPTPTLSANGVNAQDREVGAGRQAPEYSRLILTGDTHAEPDISKLSEVDVHLLIVVAVPPGV